jgi:PDZ domain
MMIDLVDGRQRSNSYEHVGGPASNFARANAKNVTPDRSSRLPTSKNPHHRTNFPIAYKPPVPPGYEPPPPRNIVTEAHAASMRGPIDALAVISDIPFDQQEDSQRDTDSDSQPGRITPAPVLPPKPATVRIHSIPDTKPIVSPPTIGRPPSPIVVIGGGHSSSAAIKVNSSYESRSSSPMSPPAIRNTVSYRSSSPVLMIGATSPSRQIQPTTNTRGKSPSRTVASLVVDDSLVGRVTPSPTAFVKHMGANQSSPARTSPLTTALLGENGAPASPRPIDEPPSLAGCYRMSPPRVSLPMARPYNDILDDEPSALTGDVSWEKPRLAATAPAVPKLSAIEDHKVGTSAGAKFDPDESMDLEEDDDSLFDFEERNKRKNKPKSLSLSEESDEVSNENAMLNQLPPALWNREQHLNTKPKSVGAPQSHGVSFGKSDIVHNYDPNGSLDADETVDNLTLSGRSLNSLYTKSAESEVEDIIKDIFMIGSGEGTNPGRRKVKYNPRVKDLLQSRDEEYEATDDEMPYTDDDEDGDNGTHEDTTATFTDTTGFSTAAETKTTTDTVSKDLPSPKPTEQSLKEKKKVSKTVDSRAHETANDEKKDDDPLTGAWAFVEHTINEMGAALGLDPQPDSSNRPKSKGKEKHPLSNSKGNEEASRSVASSREGNESSGWDLWQYLLGPAGTASENPESSQIDEGSSSDDNLDLSKSRSLEEESRYVELAVQAAMSMHHINGYEFNTSYEIDMIKDVRFSVVDLALPLGVIFQENAKGCWVNQVLPEGSAAASKGGVKVGDQLAAVDGLSAVDMTVEEIAKLIRVKKATIELTFIRYVGPLRPAMAQEEGYEISAPATPPRKKLTWSPPISPQRGGREEVSPVFKMSPKAAQSPKGILKKKGKAIETPSPTTVVPTKEAKAVEEPKKRFRLFGRRK